MSLYKHLFYFTIFSLQLALSASENSPTLTREKAVQLALENNRELRAANEIIEQASARSRYAGRLDNPNLEWGTGTDRFTQNEGSYSLSLGFTQNFPITDRLHLLKDIAEGEVDLARTEIEHRKRSLATEVERVMVSMAELDAQHGLRQKLVQLNQRFVEFIESRIEMGEASSIEANQFRVGLFALRQEMQQLEGQRVEQCAKLCELLGEDLESYHEIDFALTLPAVVPELPPLTKASLQTHPEYRLKQQLREMAAIQTRLERTKRWADISISFNIEHSREEDAPEGFESEQFVGVGVSIPLPLHDKNQGGVEASQSLERQLGAEMAALEWRLRNTAKLEASKVQRYYSQAADYEKNITRVIADNLNQLEQAYSQGQISMTELFRAEEQALKIQSTQLTMLRDYELALIEWASLTGLALTH